MPLQHGGVSAVGSAQWRCVPEVSPPHGRTPLPVLPERLHPRPQQAAQPPQGLPTWVTSCVRVFSASRKMVTSNWLCIRKLNLTVRMCRCVCLHDQSVSVRAHGSVYGLVTLWEWTAIPVSSAPKRKKTPTELTPVHRYHRSASAMTPDLWLVTSDCHTLACSCGDPTTSLIYPKLTGSLSLVHVQGWGKNTSCG